MTKLIAISIVKNEYDNFLAEWLNNVKQYADYHIIVDDCSTDGKTTQYIEQQINNGYNGELHKLDKSLFKENEVKLRGILWDKVRNYLKNTDEENWIIVVDADEFYDTKQINDFKEKYLYKNKIKQMGIAINWLDFWDDRQHFRCDGLWSPNNIKNRICKFKDEPFRNQMGDFSNLHQSPLPEYMRKQNFYKSNISLLHYSYTKKDNQQRKYDFYKKNVNMIEKMYKHNMSICDKKPVLLKYPLFKNNKLFTINKIIAKITKIFFKIGNFLLCGRLSIKKSVEFVKSGLPQSLNKTIFIFQDSFFDGTGEKFYSGGAERYILDLSQIIEQLGYFPVLIQRAKGKNSWIKQKDNLLVFGIIGCKKNKLKNFMKYFNNQLPLVICSSIDFLGTKIYNKSITISHGITFDNKNINYLKYLRLKNIVKYNKTIVSVDTNTISFFRTTFATESKQNNFIYIPNYVDCNEFKPLEMARDDDKIKILFPRRLATNRGYWLCSKIMDEIMSLGDNIEFDFVGFIHNKEIEDDLKSLMLKYKDKIHHFFIKADEMSNLYKNYDITVIPTIHSEGTSLSCLEAMASGNAIISTNIGGLTNLIINNFNGLLINPNEKELLEAIKKLIFDKQLRKTLQNNSLLLSKYFDKKIWVNRWREVLLKELKK